MNESLINNIGYKPTEMLINDKEYEYEYGNNKSKIYLQTIH